MGSNLKFPLICKLHWKSTKHWKIIYWSNRWSNPAGWWVGDLYPSEISFFLSVAYCRRFRRFFLFWQFWFCVYNALVNLGFPVGSQWPSTAQCQLYIYRQFFPENFVQLRKNGPWECPTRSVTSVWLSSILFLFLFWGMAVISTDFAIGITHCRASRVQKL